MMTREVYANRAFIEFSRSQVFIRLFVDTDSQGARLARRFGVRGFPTLIVLDGTGRELDRLVGARSAQRLRADLESIFDAAGVRQENVKQTPAQIPPQGRQNPPDGAAEAPPATGVNSPPTAQAATPADRKSTVPPAGAEPDKAAVEEPIAKMEKSLAAAKDEAEIRWLQLMLGIAHFQAQHWKEARAYLARVLEKDPANATARDLMKALENK